MDIVCSGVGERTKPPVRTTNEGVGRDRQFCGSRRDVMVNRAKEKQAEAGILVVFNCALCISQFVNASMPLPTDCVCYKKSRTHRRSKSGMQYLATNARQKTACTHQSGSSLAQRMSGTLHCQLCICTHVCRHLAISTGWHL